MDSLAPQYKLMAESGGNFYGLSVLRHKEEIGMLVSALEAKTVLDFGCGRGDAYSTPYEVHLEWGLTRSNVRLYDPAFVRHGRMPAGVFDLVICSDVLEHIEEAEVDAFIGRLFRFSHKHVWASVCCRPAKKFFPDGRNLHVTIHPYLWWHEKFTELKPAGVSFDLVETE